jgi:hypothetical protein
MLVTSTSTCGRRESSWYASVVAKRNGDRVIFHTSHGLESQAPGRAGFFNSRAEAADRTDLALTRADDYVTGA